MSENPVGPVADECLNDASTGLTLLATRRSGMAWFMGEPGPSVQQVDQLLELAVRVSDHGKLEPWRFIVIEGQAQGKLGDILVERWKEVYPETGDEVAEKQRGSFSVAPTVIAVVSSPVEHEKIPQIEQTLSAGAVCHNILLGATAMGYSAQWLSGWAAFDRPVLEKLGLSDTESIAGFMFIGTAKKPTPDRPRPDVNALTTRWNG